MWISFLFSSWKFSVNLPSAYNLSNNITNLPQFTPCSPIYHLKGMKENKWFFLNNFKIRTLHLRGVLVFDLSSCNLITTRACIENKLDRLLLHVNGIHTCMLVYMIPNLIINNKSHKGAKDRCSFWKRESWQWSMETLTHNTTLCLIEIRAVASL